MNTPQSSIRPPLHHWLAYRLLGSRVPFPYRFWVRDDALSATYPIKRSTITMLGFIAVQVAVSAGLPLPTYFSDGTYDYLGPTGWELLVYPAILAFGVAVNCIPALRRRSRRDILRTHGFDEQGVALTPTPRSPRPVPGWTYR